MSIINTGGPAFPRNILDHGHGVTVAHESGMTLRDYFAAKAMQGMLAATPHDYAFDSQSIAEAAYDMADALLKARES